MKSWSYAINSLYKTASIELRSGSGWVFCLGRAAEFCCDVVPPIRLPSTKKRLTDQEDIELNDGNPWTTWRDWYGDLSQLFHCLVHVPVFSFCERMIRTRSVETDYDKLEKMFYEEDREFWDKEIGLFPEDMKNGTAEGEIEDG